MGLDAWIGTLGTIGIESILPNLLDLKSAQIYITRGGVTAITPTEVRIETWVSRNRPTQSPAGDTMVGDLILIAEPGTDIQYGDRFFYGDRTYEVLHVLVETEPYFQATARVRD